jgi:steroid 5-alpha reductase family enzyme
MELSWPFADPATREVARNALALVGAAMTVLWLISLRLRDVSIVDVFWGAGFAILAIFYALTTDGLFARQVLLVSLVVVWGTRLALHIFRRSLGKPEDPRYAAWRAATGESYWWKSYFKVFLLQGLLMWLIAMPLLVALASPVPSRLTLLDALGVVVWATGFAFESIGDAQLRRFKADPMNRGRVLQNGLWRYTRHPNYFGDAVVWWGYFLIALAVPGGAWTVFSPVLMTFLLMRVSGVTLLEKGLKETKPGYAEYVTRTSAFFPRRPRGTAVL